jgi:hypothetical protein
MEVYVDVLGGSQGQTWLRDETSANDKSKHNMEKCPKGVAAEQNKA